MDLCIWFRVQDLGFEDFEIEGAGSGLRHWRPAVVHNVSQYVWGFGFRILGVRGRGSGF